MTSPAQYSSHVSVNEKSVVNHKEAIAEETAHQAAERGHAATDKSVLTLSSFKLMC